MVDWDGCWDKIKNFAPGVAREICEQSAEVQQQIVGIIADQAGFVRRTEFEKQKRLYERLALRCTELEQQLNAPDAPVEEQSQA